MADSIAVFSGGLDSTTLVHRMLHDGYVPDLISFDYGQKHKKELQYARHTANELGLNHDIVDLSSLGKLLNSALTDESTEVPEGHYAADNMKATVVPNRNMIMISIATGVAVSRGLQLIATGVHAGDHAVYPDCRPEFIKQADATIRLANEGFGHSHMRLAAPFVNMSKTDIARMAGALDVPIDQTWSCYKGERYHCGKCGTCVERIEALTEAGVDDPTIYEYEEL